MKKVMILYSTRRYFSTCVVYNLYVRVCMSTVLYSMYAYCTVYSFKITVYCKHILLDCYFYTFTVVVVLEFNLIKSTWLFN